MNDHAKDGCARPSPPLPSPTGTTPLTPAEGGAAGPKKLTRSPVLPPLAEAMRSSFNGSAFQDSAFQDSARARANRDRADSNQSHGSMGHGGGGLRYRGPGGRSGDRVAAAVALADAAAAAGLPQALRSGTDARLILAGMDEVAVEDEAEATLLDVLERRQVTFSGQAAPPPSRHRRHRRHQSSQYDAIQGIDFQDLLGDVPAQRPSSAPSSSEAAAQQSGRPPLISKTKSLGRSRRNLLQKPPPSLSSSQRAITADWAFDAEGNLMQSFSGLSNDGGEYDKITQSGEAAGMTTRLDGYAAQSTTGTSNAGGNASHRRAKSSLAAKGVLEQHASESSKSSVPLGLNTPWERARHVARTMKKISAANNVDDVDASVVDGDLPDLMHIIEQKRDNDSQSIGSGSKGGMPRRGSMGSQSAARASVENHSLQSGSRSAENQVSWAPSSKSGSANQRHQRQRPFSGISSSPFSNDGGGVMSNIDQLFQVAEHMHELCQIPEGEGEEDEYLHAREASDRSIDLEARNSNFLDTLFASHPEVPPADLEEEGEAPKAEPEAADEQTPMLQQMPRRSSPRRRQPTIWSITQPTPDTRFYKILLWWSYVRKQTRVLALAFDADYVKNTLWSFLQNEVSLYIVPALAISAFFFYRMNNPIFTALPAGASVSWLILFAIRHYLTLQLAYSAEYLIVDVLAMRSTISIALAGPVATLYTVNAKGWPFVLTAWGMLNLVLIQQSSLRHANHSFYSHWLYFTEIEMFTDENTSGEICQSETYKAILQSMIIAGAATSLKRTVLALYLGKRIYIHYKPKLEKIFESMILLNEVADLGDAIDDFEFEKVQSAAAVDRDSGMRSLPLTTKSSMLSDKLRTSTMIAVVKTQKERAADSDSDDDDAEEKSKGSIGSSMTPWNRLRSQSEDSDENENLTEDHKVPSQETLDNLNVETQFAGEDENIPEQTTTSMDKLPPMDNAEEPPVPTVHEPVHNLLREKSATVQIKYMLDNWEEPVNKQDKIDDPTIQDILQFRQALRLLDDTHPFGSSFGPAFTRDTCIKSAKALYKRLLALSPGDSVLNFDIIGVLAYNLDGGFDNKKAKSLVRLFRPDRFDEVSMLHFVSSCDSVYKKLRFFRASVGNSTLIDSVLENIANGAFGFVLGLLILSLLKLNPWTLLVSMSTVLVSFAFALGPSAAKIIEGMIMIAVRRPFDLGDRISIVDTTGSPDNSDDPGYHDTWIVEDCNLFTTSLRLSRSNEVSSVNNGSIANTRIVNHNRSHNALVNIPLRVKIETTSDRIDLLKQAIEQYLQNKPRVWSCLINFRVTSISPDSGYVAYSARVQHVKSWQDLLPVLSDKGDLEKFINEILTQLDIIWDCNMTNNTVFIKELPNQHSFPDEDASFPDGGVPGAPPETHHQNND